MFEGWGIGVKGVIKDHNSVSLPRVKKGRKRRRGGGEMKGSPTSTSRREEGEGWEEKRSTKLL